VTYWVRSHVFAFVGSVSSASRSLWCFRPKELPHFQLREWPECATCSLLVAGFPQRPVEFPPRPPRQLTIPTVCQLACSRRYFNAESHLSLRPSSAKDGWLSLGPPRFLARNNLLLHLARSLRQQWKRPQAARNLVFPRYPASQSRCPHPDRGPSIARLTVLPISRLLFGHARMYRTVSNRPVGAQGKLRAGRVSRVQDSEPCNAVFLATPFSPSRAVVEDAYQLRLSQSFAHWNGLKPTKGLANPRASPNPGNPRGSLGERAPVLSRLHHTYSFSSTVSI
jgi:hypothetical protein